MLKPGDCEDGWQARRFYWNNLQLRSTLVDSIQAHRHTNIETGLFEGPVEQWPITMSQCHGVQEESYDVVVQYPKSLGLRFGKCLECLFICCFSCFGILLFMAIASFCYVWIPVIMSRCHKPPGIGLANVSIFNMTLQESNNTFAPGWLVHAKFNVTLSTWNRNTVAKCFSTYRTLNAVVKFKNSLILRQSVPLGFSLKPQAERSVLMDLIGDQFTMKQDLGPVMQEELQTGNVTMEFFFNIRYLIADRRSKWHRFGCSVVVKSPLLQSTGSDTLVDQQCYST